MAPTDDSSTDSGNVPDTQNPPQNPPRIPAMPPDTDPSDVPQSDQ